MQRMFTLLLISTLVFPSCAARGAGLAAQRTAGPSSTPVQTSPDVWRKFAERIRIGSTVKVWTTSGERLTADLLVVEAEGITVSPKTRIPEPVRQFSFDELTQLELISESSNLAKAAAIGAGVGGGTFLGLLMLMLAAWDD